MKSIAASLLALGALASAGPVQRRFNLPGDTASDLDNIASGTADCASVGALFARGTFDSGNVGVWVGPDLMNALGSRISSFAAQGVDPTQYPANLNDYLNHGGSDSGAAAMAAQADAFISKCPNSVVVFAGWSQGSLVAHKALQLVQPATLQKIAGMVTFGDMHALFSDSTDPISESSMQTYCITGTVFDPLCASLPDGFAWPTSLGDIVGPFADLPSVAQGAEETAAAVTLVAQFPGQLLAAVPELLNTLPDQTIQRFLLTPAHFTYGNAGFTDQAADFIANLDAVKAAGSA